MADERTQTAELLLFNTGILYRLLRGEARRHGIRWSGLMVLRDLSLLGVLSQRQLADIEQLRAATLSLLVKELLAEDLVSRTPDPADARAFRVRITEAGRSRLERDATLLARSLETVLAPLDDPGHAELVRGETRLADILRQRLASQDRAD